MSVPITVLMSVYNGERWLSESISSVLRQSHSDFEFIIVNDGSTDASLDIMNSFAVSDSRIKLIDKSNTGLADSLNVGINEAQGEWIARIDADDICEPQRLEIQSGVAASNRDAVFVGSGLILIDEYGSVIARRSYNRHHAILLRDLYSAHAFPPHSSAFFRTDVAKRIGGYRTRIKRAQDCDLWLRLSEHGELLSVSEELVQIRKHSHQVSYEDAGRRQKIDSRVAIVSYFLRNQGVSDPVSGCKERFEIFREWIIKQLEYDSSFSYFAFAEYISSIFKKKRSIQASAFEFISTIICSPRFSARYFISKLFGDTFPRKYAEKWIREYHLAGKPKKMA